MKIEHHARSQTNSSKVDLELEADEFESNNNVQKNLMKMILNQKNFIESLLSL
jgi:hypothetical protein